MLIVVVSLHIEDYSKILVMKINKLLNYRSSIKRN